MPGNREPKAGRFAAVAVAVSVVLVLAFASGCSSSDSGDVTRGDGAPPAESLLEDGTDGEAGGADDAGTSGGELHGSLDIDGDSKPIALVDPSGVVKCTLDDDFVSVVRVETPDGWEISVNGGIKTWTGRVITDAETWVAAYADPAIDSDANMDLVAGHLVLEGTWVSETGGDDTAQIRLEVICPST